MPSIINQCGVSANRVGQMKTDLRDTTLQGVPRGGSGYTHTHTHVFVRMQPPSCDRVECEELTVLTLLGH